MEHILQVFITLVLLTDVIFANQYRDVREISLKKDSQKKILVKYDKYEKLLKFRWTLYVNGGLVVLHSLNNQVLQNILYLNHKNQSFRVELKPRGASHYTVPYLLVKFKEFNYQRKEAVFELFLSDKESEVRLKYFKNI